MSRVDRTTNNEHPAIELVSRRIRVSPHPTLPRAGTLAPGWYDSTAATASPATNLNESVGDGEPMDRQLSAVPATGKRQATSCCSRVKRSCRHRANSLGQLQRQAISTANFRRARHRLAGITHDRQTASVTHAASTDKVHRTLSTVSGGEWPSRSLFYSCRAPRCYSSRRLQVPRVCSVAQRSTSIYTEDFDLKVVGYVIFH